VPISCDILERRADGFVLWCPRPQSAAPQLVLGELRTGNPPRIDGVRRFPMKPTAGLADLYELPAAVCGLQDDTTYHYWFEVDDSRASAPGRIAVTDPFATRVDWRAFPPGTTSNTQPAAVVHHVAQGKLAAADPGGETPTFEAPDAPDALPPNNQLVIYELPVAWALSRSLNMPERAAATFADVTALVDERVGGANFAGPVAARSRQRLSIDLGVNAIELLPPADSFFILRLRLVAGHRLHGADVARAGAARQEVDRGDASARRRSGLRRARGDLSVGGQGLHNRGCLTDVIARSEATKQSRGRTCRPGLLRSARNDRRPHTRFRSISCLAMMMRCISLVPSPMMSSGASR